MAHLPLHCCDGFVRDTQAMVPEPNDDPKRDDEPDEEPDDEADEERDDKADEEPDDEPEPGTLKDVGALLTFFDFPAEHGL
jgi:hypothetical protein